MIDTIKIRLDNVTVLEAVTVRVESNLKKEVQQILESLGLNQSVVINMLYRQIAFNKRIPFDISLPDTSKKSKK